MQVSIIIPTINEEESLGFVLSSIPMHIVDEIIVVDGGSTDDTVAIAETGGARVIHEPRRGYGQACATGAEKAIGDIVVFLDADGADDPANLPQLLEPILSGDADMALGSRLAGEIEKGTMPWQQYFGNWLSALLIRLLYRLPITDLSPFRAVKKSKLLELGMTEMTYGWPTEMIVKAANAGWKIREIPVNYHKRYGGQSKISGTLRGTVLATYFILSTIFKYLFNAKSQRGRDAEKPLIDSLASARLSHSALIIMAKEPKLGSTKTRLCPPLSLEGAVRLYEALLLDTIEMTEKLVGIDGNDGIDLAIAITPPESQGYFESISPPGTLQLPVTCADIGECLTKVLGQLLALGYKKVIALNADGPSLPMEFIQDAIELLDKNDLVFGPSEDGGYYLIGMKEKTPEIFTGIAWSTSQVLEQTLAKAESLGLKVALTSLWYDIDTFADIERLRLELASIPSDRLIHCRRYFDEN